MADRDNASEASSSLRQLVIFRVAAQRFALPVESVERIVGAVAVTPLPGG